MSYRKKYSFENLEVYKKGKILVVYIYQVTQKFPKEEQFGLTAQLRRAATSLVLNIAEGLSRNSIKEKLRFIEISFGSSMEVLAAASICVEIGLLKIEEEDEIREEINEYTMLLTGLKRKLESSEGLLKEGDPPLYETNS